MIIVGTGALAAVATWVGGLMPELTKLLSVANFAVSFLMVTLLFAAIYKILPDRQLHWRDVAVGAAVTALLFTIVSQRERFDPYLARIASALNIESQQVAGARRVVQDSDVGVVLDDGADRECRGNRHGA